MSDPIIAAAARAAAERLAPDHDPALAVDVEATLHAREANQRPSQYFDPISLASLIVVIATLAWTIYSDQRKETPHPPPAVVARQVRAELRQHADRSQQETDRIIEIVVTEMIELKTHSETAPRPGSNEPA